MWLPLVAATSAPPRIQHILQIWMLDHWLTLIILKRWCRGSKPGCWLLKPLLRDLWVMSHSKSISLHIMSSWGINSSSNVAGCLTPGTLNECVLCCVSLVWVCFPARSAGDWYWSMCAVCSVSLSSPQHWSPLGDLWSPGADQQPNYVGGAQLDCTPIHLPHSTPKKQKTFHLSTTVNAGFCQGHKSPGETEWKCSHKLLGLNVTSHQRQHAVLHACQQTMLLEGLLEPVYEDHI